MIPPAALLFDFDGVLIESEAASNRQIAAFLTAAGHPTSAEDSMARFMGLADVEFHDAVRAYVGGPLPDGFVETRRAEAERMLVDGLEAVAGAIDFVTGLPETLPVAIVSSSSTRWIGGHLDHLGLRERFAPHLYSGREHVDRGKPAPDLYLYAAASLGVPIAACAIIEDSPIGATGAVASGGTVIGLCAGSHCPPDHASRLREIGVAQVAASFAEVRALLRL